MDKEMAAPAHDVPGTDARQAGIDPAFDRAVLQQWREDGSRLIPQHWAEFQELLDLVRGKVAFGHWAEAAAAAQHAANHAALWHTGLFTSNALDCLLQRIGEAALPHASRRTVRRRGEKLSILHIATRVPQISGHARMIWRWIAHDAANCHSVALTRQFERLPDRLQDEVTRSGGGIHCVNRTIGTLLAWAGELQARISEADLVVLHTHGMDILPFLALGGMRNRPPVILHNHSDHLFWVGAGLVDLVASSRRSGLQTCLNRRDIPPERNFLVPLCLELPGRQLSRSEAKRALGLPDDSIVMLSIARAVKYRATSGITFPDAFLPVLQADPRTRLMVIGPGGTEDWSRAEARAPGQIIALGERADTGVYLAAADIYVDSLPFVSITSLLEAGLNGLPLVTRNPFGGHCALMGADSFGLDEVVLRGRDLDDFQRKLSFLVADPQQRVEIGARTAASIRSTNTGEGWTGMVHALYERALEIPRRSRPSMTEDGPPSLEDLDVFLHFAYGEVEKGATRTGRLEAAMDLKAGPGLWRMRQILALTRQPGFFRRRGRECWRLLIPEWLGCRLRPLVPRRSG